MKISDALSKRLDELPKNTAIAFRDLSTRGHIGEEALSTVLDAGEISGERGKLLGFAISYLWLTAAGVPIQDTIRMARSQGRPVNLQWSARRWKSEHDRLARIATLNTLAAENFTYDLSAFDQLVPQEQKHTLIRTSRRLGLEGLRQRHCVADYDKRIRRGTCAFASVIIQRKRWTVGLSLGRDGALGVATICGRFNQKPDPEIRQIIHDRFAVEDTVTAVDSYFAPRPTLMEDTLKLVLAELRRRKISHASVYFAGGGDEGSIESASYSDAAFDGSAVKLTIKRAVKEFRHDHWGWNVVEAEVSLDQAIMDVSEEYIDSKDVNWWDAEGGFGHLRIDAVEGEIDLEINVNTSKSVLDETRKIDASPSSHK